MSLKSQRMIAAKILKVGKNRVWIDPERIDEVETAITRSEIERLIKDGVIKAKPVKGVSRGRARIKHKKRKMGRGRGPGSRKGAKYARLPRKRRWIQTIRAIRKKLKELVQTRAITTQTYRKLYRLAKGGVFRSKAHMLQYIESEGLYRRKPR
ncbi:MAG: 50S ribosomal protein L19e [Candidatus Hecatellales archaeon]|nr:MAG: 50S ribosomal protein L19e [Candidatus Hecatellales archaeon]